MDQGCFGGKACHSFAWEDDVVVGYATFALGIVRWTRHVAELRVVVAQSARGIGIGRLLLELAFETVLNMGVTKVIARMTPDQADALRLFQRLGFAEEAVLRDHALGRTDVPTICWCSASTPACTRNNAVTSVGFLSWTRWPWRVPGSAHIATSCGITSWGAVRPVLSWTTSTPGSVDTHRLCHLHYW